jgi:hypothetical protein
MNIRRGIGFRLGHFALLLLFGCTERLLAQSPPPPPAGGSYGLTAEERQAAERAAVSDERARSIAGAKPRVITGDVEVDKAEADAYLAGKSEKLPSRRVTIVLFDVKANRAVRVVISLGDYRVTSFQSIPASDVPFVREDADDALALAKADAAVRRALGEGSDRFEILDSGSEARVPFAVQALPLRSTDPKDPCHVDRCLDLIFRTESGYLSMRAHVDLTRRTVSVVRHEGRHS